LGTGVIKVREEFVKYFDETVEVLIHVVDCTDINKLEESIFWLENWLSDKRLKNIFLVVLANKQDLDCVVDVGDITSEISKYSIKQKYVVLKSSAKTGEGLIESLDLIIDHLKIKLSL
jgi:ADP-ribosylation factor-like protein 1